VTANVSRTPLDAAIRASRARGNFLPDNVAVIAKAKLVRAVADNRTLGVACGGAACDTVGGGRA